MKGKLLLLNRGFLTARLPRMPSSPILSPGVQNKYLAVAASRSWAANLRQWPESSLSVLKSPCARPPVCQVPNLFNLGLLSSGEYFKASSGAASETPIYLATWSTLTLPCTSVRPVGNSAKGQGRGGSARTVPWVGRRSSPMLSSFVL